MNKNELVFHLNKVEKIVIELRESIYVVDCCYEAPIVLLHDSIHRTTLSNDAIKDSMHVLSVLLTKALHKDLMLHHSITKDIGYLYNEYCDLLWHEDSQVKSDFAYTKLEGRNYWVGEQYDLWGYDSTGSWLYNGTDGAIIFEVTPVYPGGFGDPERKAKAIPYEEWIQDYKPYFIRTIPHSVAQQWLEQANNILKVIERNIETERAAHKDNHT